MVCRPDPRQQQLIFIDSQIAQLKEQKNQAAKAEIYDKAHEYKLQIEALEKKRAELLRLPVSPPTQPIQPVTSPRKDVAAKKTPPPQNAELVRAAGHNQTDVAMDLLDLGVDINSVDFTTGNTGLYTFIDSSVDAFEALHASVENGLLDFAKFLVKRGADLNARNRRGQVPLHLSLERRSEFDGQRFSDRDEIVDTTELLISSWNAVQITPSKTIWERLL